MEALIVCSFLALILALAVLARAVRLPYPIVFLLGGIALALIPGLPPLRLDPELVFLLFLPPLVFGDGYMTDWRQFRRYIRPITALATGLVIATSVAVAFVANAVIGLPLPIGLVLGAILSPTDTVATEAVAASTGMPRRIETILSGESLVNDATGLTLYKFAVGAIAAGAFSWSWAIPQFVYVTVVGIAIGVLAGLALAKLPRLLTDRGLADESIVVLITLVSPFVLYLAADRIGASGVLAAAVGGITISRNGGGISTSDARIVASGVWSMLFFIFNGALFIVLGLELRETFAALRAFPLPELIGYAAAIAATVIVTRLAWVFVVAEVRWRLDRNIVAREGERPPRSWTLVLGWAGMRGIVSLAAALALPETMGGGADAFPARDLILFTTFAVILVTLLGQGLTLPWLIRRLRVRDAEDGSRTVAVARLRTAEAGLSRLRELEPSFVSAEHWEVAGKLRSHYEEQISHFTAAAEGAPADGHAGMLALTRTFVRETMEAERRILIEMRHLGEITDDVYRHINYELDLAEARLA